ncbi:hypothetical protein LBMAG32_10480 [Nitrosomonadaceae bacterium]|nr:hypothetical protein LBMAG32_10480 [Nitrosomonadaceae bacterium]
MFRLYILFLEIKYELCSAKNNSCYQRTIQLPTIYVTRDVDDERFRHISATMGKNFTPYNRHYIANKRCLTDPINTAVFANKYMAWR